MPIPEERTGVPPDKVENLKKIMMQNPQVKPNLNSEIGHKKNAFRKAL